MFRLYSPRRPQRDLIHHCPVQSLPPLRAFLRNKGINADIDARRPQLVGIVHESAREEARRRALKAPATRYVCPLAHRSPQSYCLSLSTTVDPAPRLEASTSNCSIPLQCVCQSATTGQFRPLVCDTLVNGVNRNLDCGNPPYHRKPVRRFMSPPCMDDRYTLKAISSPRPSGSRPGTAERRLPREVESCR